VRGLPHADVALGTRARRPSRHKALKAACFATVVQLSNAPPPRLPSIDGT
jgi:hypothetical protein